MKKLTDLSSLRQKIRKLIRRRRQEISYENQREFAKNAATQAKFWSPIDKAKSVALFLSFDGELSTQPLIDYLWNKGKKVYLPVIHPFIQGNLLFLNYQMNTDLIMNRFKIKEPKLDVRDVLPLNFLDILIVPLVAFNSYGYRLGMGGGFYDRVMKNCEKNKFKPVGYAYDCQFVDFRFEEQWDIPLPTVITPSKLWSFKN